MHYKNSTTAASLISILIALSMFSIIFTANINLMLKIKCQNQQIQNRLKQFFHAKNNYELEYLAHKK